MVAFRSEVSEILEAVSELFQDNEVSVGTAALTVQPTREIIMKSLDYDLFGKRLRARRTDLGYTLEDVSQNTDMSNSYYGNWERRIKQPSVLENFLRVCLFLETDPRYFFGLIDTPNPDEATYQPRSHSETEEIADIVDELPEGSRKRLLEIVKLEVEAVKDWEGQFAEKQKHLRGMIQRLVEGLGEGESDLCPLLSLVMRTEFLLSLSVTNTLRLRKPRFNKISSSANSASSNGHSSSYTLNTKLSF